VAAWVGHGSSQSGAASSSAACPLCGAALHYFAVVTQLMQPVHQRCLPARTGPTDAAPTTRKGHAGQPCQYARKLALVAPSSYANSVHAPAYPRNVGVTPSSSPRTPSAATSCLTVAPKDGYFAGASCIRVLATSTGTSNRCVMLAHRPPASPWRKYTQDTAGCWWAAVAAAPLELRAADVGDARSAADATCDVVARSVDGIAA
jgi:hypothetical protein